MTYGHQIRNLDEKKWFAVTEGRHGNLMVNSNSDLKEQMALEKGEFYLAENKDDPEFRDVPHFYLFRKRVMSIRSLCCLLKMIIR